MNDLEFINSPHSEKWNEIYHMLCGFSYVKSLDKSGEKYNLTIEETKFKTFYNPKDEVSMSKLTDGLTDAEIRFANKYRYKYRAVILKIIGRGINGEWKEFETQKDKMSFLKNEHSESNYNNYNALLAKGVKKI